MTKLLVPCLILIISQGWYVLMPKTDYFGNITACFLLVMLEDVTSTPLYFYCKKRSAFQLKNKNLFLLLLLLSIIEISLPNVTNWIRPWSGLTAHEAWYALS